jgi:hypothetical protein
VIIASIPSEMSSSFPFLPLDFSLDDDAMDVVLLFFFPFFFQSLLIGSVGSPSKGHPRHSGKSQNRLPSPFLSIKGEKKENPADGPSLERGGEMRRVQSGPKERKGIGFDPAVLPRGKRH